MDQHKKFGTCKRTRHKLFQKRGHYSRGNIIQGRTLFKGGHYLKKYGITYHPKGCPRRTFANDPVFVFCHIRGCRLRSPFFCSSLECTVLLTSSCSTRFLSGNVLLLPYAMPLQARLAMFGRSTNFFTVAAHTPYTWPLPAVLGKMVLTRQSFKSQGSFWPSCKKGYVI